MHAMRIARGVHGPQQDREVRGPVPRRPRLRPDLGHPERHGRARRRGQPGRAGVGPRHPGGGREDRHPGALQRDGRPAPDLRARRRATSRRSSSSRSSATPRAILPAPGLPRGDARAHPRVRRAAHLRRGQDRLPVRPRRRRRVLRRHAGPRDVTPRRWATATPRPRSAARDEVMSVLPDKVSHGGTYAGNRVAAAAAVATLKILRDTDALAIDPPGRARASRRASPRSSRSAGCRTSSPATRRCSGSCSRSRRRPSTATGRTRTTTCTTPSRWACTPAARCPSRTRASRGSSARPTPARTSSTGSSSIFADSLDAALEARAHGRAPRRRTRRTWSIGSGAPAGDVAGDLTAAEARRLPSSHARSRASRPGRRSSRSLRDYALPILAHRRRRVRPAARVAPVRPRHRQGADGPRGDRGHGPGAVRGRAQEADGHARRPRRATSSGSSSSIIAGLMVLRAFGLDIGPAVAGLGVVGVAVGFGAQHLVRDYLNGALILIENQFSKGDVIRAAGVSGHRRGLQPPADDAARPRRRRPHRARTARSWSPAT